MKLPNPTKLLPHPRHLRSLAQRAGTLLPNLPGRGSAPETAPAPEGIEPRPLAPPPKPSTSGADAAKPKVAKPKTAKPKAAKTKKPKAAKPKTAKPKAAKAKPKAAKDPGDISGGRDPHHALNNPVGEPDPTAWPDPYDPDSPEQDPHPDQDPGAQARREKVQREKLDD
jgi:hypothetical protein